MSGGYDDDDDAFLYGDEPPASHPPPFARDTFGSYKSPPNGTIGDALNLDSNHEPLTSETIDALERAAMKADMSNGLGDGMDFEDSARQEDAEDEVAAEDDDDDSESDIEIIMEDVGPVRSVDFRGGAAPGVRPLVPPRTSSVSVAGTPAIALERRPIHLTTEYTPRDRPAPGAAIPPSSKAAPVPKEVPAPIDTVAVPAEDLPLVAPKPVQPDKADAVPQLDARAEDDASAPSTQTYAQPQTQPHDPSLLFLPPATAPPSAPKIDPTEPGMLPDQTSVFDIDMNNLSEKTWRKQGSDLSDWFNYGFDEISWEAFCVRRRELGEAAAMLKGAVLNLAALPEEQIQHIPPEMRSTLIAQASLMGVGMPPGSMNGMMGGGPQGMGGMGPQGMMMGPGGANGSMGGMGMGMGGMGPNGGAGMHPDMMGMNGMGGMMGMHHPQMTGMNGGGQPGMGGGMMGPGGGMGGGGASGGGPNNPMSINHNMNVAAFSAGGPGGGGLPQDSPMNANIGLSGGGHVKLESPDVAAGGMMMGMPIPTGLGGGGVSDAGGGSEQGMAAVVGSDFGVQQQESHQPGHQQQQQMYGADPSTSVPTARGGFRGVARGGRGGRGAGMYAARGRGGGLQGPTRPVSPLPSNVPTGPRNQNRYKDKDREAGDSKVIEGLDYGGGGGGGGGGSGSISGRGSADREKEKDSRDRDRSDRDRDRDRERDSHRRDRDRDRDREKDRDRESRRESRRDRDKDKDKEKEKSDEDGHREKDKESRRDSSSRKDKHSDEKSSRKRRNSASEDGREASGRSSKRR